MAERANKRGTTGCEKTAGLPAEISDAGGFFYQNPDGSVIQLLQRDGAIVTVAVEAWATG
jgi:hypothetical protein